MTNTQSKPSLQKGVENTSGLAARLAARKKQQSRYGITWQDAHDAKLSQAISSVVDTGSLISFSRTSDGGALVLTILDGTDKTPYYVTTGEEVDELLSWLIEETKPL